MKKSLLALAVLGTFAGAAAAQSSVTLFGAVDLSLKYVENGSVENKQLGSDGLQSSRFGVRGVEDLGGGLRAGFHLESGLNAGTGASDATFWQRRSTVSLLGGFGEVRLGRDLNPIFLTHGTYDPFGTIGVGTSFNLISTLGSGVVTTVRTNNMVAYLTPTTIPFYAHIGVAPSEGVAGNKFVGGRVGFGTGPFDISIGASKTEADLAGTLDYEQKAIGGSFDFGFMKLFAYYLLNENSRALAGESTAREQSVAQIALTFPIGQSLIKAVYARSEMDGTGTVVAPFRSIDEADLFAVQYNYNLSRRTALYASYSQISNDNGANFQIPSAVAGASPAAGFKSKGYEFGVRHAF